MIFGPFLGQKNAFFDFQIPKMAQKLVFLSKHVENNCLYGSWLPNEAVERCRNFRNGHSEDFVF